jgi:MIP family channel proteins
VENVALRNYLAELLGTFTLVFIGSLSILAAVAADAPLTIAVAFGFGLALLAGLYAFAELSGGHFNPAVSLAMLLNGRLDLPTMIGYWISQFLGAILASLAVLAAFSQDDVAGTVTGATNSWDAFWLELLLTALFVMVILQSSRSQRVFGTALLAIPLTLVAIHLAAIPTSGSSVNPVRSLGPALVGNEWGDIWIYLTAPLIGAVIGGMIHLVLYGRYVVVDVETVEVAPPEA